MHQRCVWLCCTRSSLRQGSVSLQLPVGHASAPSNHAVQEAKPYKSDNEVLAMTNLVEAYQKNNIREFEKILRTNK